MFLTDGEGGRGRFGPLDTIQLLTSAGREEWVCEGVRSEIRLNLSQHVFGHTCNKLKLEHFYPRESRILEIGMSNYHAILNSKRIPRWSQYQLCIEKKAGFLPAQFLLPVERYPHRLTTW